MRYWSVCLFLSGASGYADSPEWFHEGLQRAAARLEQIRAGNPIRDHGLEKSPIPGRSIADRGGGCGGESCGRRAPLDTSSPERLP
jgi:hypothetical protein